MDKSVEQAIAILEKLKVKAEPLYETPSTKQDKAKSSDSTPTYWPAGTGYGFGYKSTSDMNTSKQLSILESVDKRLFKLATQLSLISPKTKNPSLCSSLSTIITPLMELIFDNDSILDISASEKRYESAIEVLNWCLKCRPVRKSVLTPALADRLRTTRSHYETFKLFYESRLNEDWRLGSLFDKLWGLLQLVEPSAELECVDVPLLTPPPKRKRSSTKYKDWKPNVKTRSSQMDTLETSAVDPLEAYKEAFMDLQFGECDLGEHAFRTANPERLSSQLILRLSQEMACLATSLPLSPSGSIFVRFDSSRMDLIRAMITGPHGTPYQNGLFLFDIGIPAEYPAKPPLIRLLTTHKGTIRFNPNLYANGLVCLSLLASWTGSKSEKWSAGKSTLFQLLVSIQSLVLNEEPYFNEPGYETLRGTPQGTKNSQEWNTTYQGWTQRYAIQAWLDHESSSDFDRLARLHLKHTRPTLPGLNTDLDWMNFIAPPPV